MTVVRMTLATLLVGLTLAPAPSAHEPRGAVRVAIHMPWTPHIDGDFSEWWWPP